MDGEKPGGILSVEEGLEVGGPYSHVVGVPFARLESQARRLDPRASVWNWTTAFPVISLWVQTFSKPRSGAFSFARVHIGRLRECSPVPISLQLLSRVVGCGYTQGPHNWKMRSVVLIVRRGARHENSWDRRSHR